MKIPIKLYKLSFSALKVALAAVILVTAMIVTHHIPCIQVNASCARILIVKHAIQLATAMFVRLDITHIQAFACPVHYTASNAKGSKVAIFAILTIK